MGSSLRRSRIRPWRSLAPAVPPPHARPPGLARTVSLQIDRPGRGASFGINRATGQRRSSCAAPAPAAAQDQACGRNTAVSRGASQPLPSLSAQSSGSRPFWLRSRCISRPAGRPEPPPAPPSASFARFSSPRSVRSMARDGPCMGVVVTAFCVITTEKTYPFADGCQPSARHAVVAVGASVRASRAQSSPEKTVHQIAKEPFHCINGKKKRHSRGFFQSSWNLHNQVVGVPKGR